MRRLIAILAALAAFGTMCPSHAQEAKHAFPYTLTTTPQQVTIGKNAGGGLNYFRINNPGTSGSAWCSRASITPAPNAAGSYEIPPGQTEEFYAPFVPDSRTWCVSAAGTVPLTVENR